MLKSENTMQEDEMLVFEEEYLQQITKEQRHQIITFAKFLKLNLNDLEFRQTGIRYKYWNNVEKLAELINDNVIPCEHDFLEDSDCGNLYYIVYNGYEDNEFPDGSHNIRYYESHNKIKKRKRNNKMQKTTQKQQVLSRLKEGYGVTPIDALQQFGCFRLAAVIFDLKKDGYDIKTTMIKTGNKKYAVYGLKNHNSWN